jgi:hypothetical protein
MICSKNIFCENYVMLGKIFAMSGKILHGHWGKILVCSEIFLVCSEKIFFGMSWKNVLVTPHPLPPLANILWEKYLPVRTNYTVPPPPIRLGPYAHACGSLYSTVGDHQKLLRTWYTETIFKCLHQKTFR